MSRTAEARDSRHFESMPFGTLRITRSSDFLAIFREGFFNHVVIGAEEAGNDSYSSTIQNMFPKPLVLKCQFGEVRMQFKLFGIGYFSLLTFLIVGSPDSATAQNSGSLEKGSSARLISVKESAPDKLPKFGPRQKWNEAVKDQRTAVTITVPQTQSNIGSDRTRAEPLRAQMLKAAQGAFGTSIAAVRERGADVYIGSEKVGELYKGELLHVGDTTSNGWVGVSRVEDFPFAWVDRKLYRLNKMEGWVRKESLILMSQAKEALIYRIPESRLNNTFGPPQIQGELYYSK